MEPALLNKPTILVPLKQIDLPANCGPHKITEMIRKSGGEVYKLQYKNPDVNCTNLKEEVESIVKHLKTTSIARDLLDSVAQNQHHYPEIAKIINDVKQSMRGIDGVVLTGGEDIQPIFYGQDLHEKTEKSDDLRRDLYECAVLNEADELKLPVFGVCRGLQLGNIWYGGTLNQHVDGHNKCIQTYTTLENRSGVVASVVRQAENGLKCDSRHHQTVCKIADNLKVTLQSEDGTIKALEGLQDRFLVFVQWHPETCQDESMKGITSPENFELFKEVVQAAKRG